MSRDIDALNDEMVAAGVRIFVGGLSPASSARSVRAQPDGNQRKQLSGSDNTDSDAGVKGRCRGAASRVSIPASKWHYLAHRKPGTLAN
jgi:hypothetical protein